MTARELMALFWGSHESKNHSLANVITETAGQHGYSCELACSCGARLILDQAMLDVRRLSIKQARVAIARVPWARTAA